MQSLKFMPIVDPENCTDKTVTQPVIQLAQFEYVKCPAAFSHNVTLSFIFNNNNNNNNACVKA